jgi:hypothetical protein
MKKKKARLEKVTVLPNFQRTPNSIFQSHLYWNSILVFISALVLGYYLWTAGSNGVPLIVDVGPEEYFKQVPTPCLFPDISPHHYGFYNLMADAYSAGRADLLLDPPKELLELKNPRDPEQNAPWRILDLSLHNGRYYLYFGPVPTLTLFIPFRWLGIGKISEPLAAVFYCYGLFLCSTFILLRCVKLYIPNCNRWLLIFAILGLGLSNTSPYLLRHPTVYEVAIAAGAFFSMLGLCFLLTAWQRWRPEHAGAHRDAATGELSLPLLSAASLCFGLAVGSRPIYIFICIFLFLLWLGFFWKRGLFTLESLKSGFAMASPFVICVAGIALFNYKRFGSPSDFGLEKMMSATLWDFSNGYRFCNILPGLFLRAICPPQINDLFPFIRLHQFYPLDLPEGYSMEEVSGGFLTTSPIILLFFILAFFWMKGRYNDQLVHFSSSLIFIGTIILIIESYMMWSNSMRYQLDFAPQILLGSIIGILAMSEKNPWKSPIFRFFSILLLSVGVVVHIMISLTGFRDTLRRGEPRQYFALENFLSSASAFLTPFFGFNKTQIVDITTPTGSARFDDGTEGPWLGEEGFYVRFTAAQTIPMQFSADVVVRPDLPDGVNLDFQNPTGPSKSSVVKGISRQTFQFTLQPGSNRISIFATPNSPTLKDQDKLRIAVLRNIQITPNSTR